MSAPTSRNHLADVALAAKFAGISEDEVRQLQADGKLMQQAGNEIDLWDLQAVMAEIKRGQ